MVDEYFVKEEIMRFAEKELRYEGTDNSGTRAREFKDVQALAGRIEKFMDEHPKYYFGAIAQSLHDSEINASISWFWDKCYEGKLGDALNGFTFETTRGEGLWETVDLLHLEACEQFPKSAHMERCFPDEVLAQEVRAESLDAGPRD